MKKNFKKILIVVFALVLSLSLFACTTDNNENNNNNNNDKTIEVNYETNGGSEVAKQEVKTTDATTFTLPTDPVKEGYTFAGWYLDADFTQAFTSLADLANTITLYAKWVEVTPVAKSMDVTTTISLDLTTSLYEEEDDDEEDDDNEENYPTTDKEVDGLDQVEEIPSEETPVEEETEEAKEPVVTNETVDVTLHFVCDDTEVKALDDFTGMLSYDVKYNKLTVAKGTIYLMGGYVYAQVPMGITSMKAKVQLETLYNTLLEIVEEYVAEYADQFGIELPEETPTITEEEVEEEAEKLIEEVGLSKETLEQLEAALKKLMPTLVQDGNTYTYKYTQEDYEEFVDSIVKVITDNFDEFSNIVSEAIELYNQYSPIIEGFIENEETQGEETETPTEGEEGTEEEPLISLETILAIVKAYLPKVSEQAKKMIQINKLEEVYTKNDNGDVTSSDTNIDVKVTLDEDEYVWVKLTVTTTINTETATVDTSKLDASYLDYTYMLVETINNYAKPTTDENTEE